jgi:hypothetical protein
MFGYAPKAGLTLVRRCGRPALRLVAAVAGIAGRGGGLKPPDFPVSDFLEDAARYAGIIEAIRA